MTFAQSRTLIREITAAAIEVARAERIEVKCVVVTREQYGAILAVLERPRISTNLGHLAVLCDEDIGAPLPDGQFQVLEFIPKKSNRIARDLIGDVLVSTIDLAAHLDEDAIPICFPAHEPRYETSVLHALDDARDRTRRLFTRESALAAHAEEVAKVRAEATEGAAS